MATNVNSHFRMMNSGFGKHSFRRCERVVRTSAGRTRTGLATSTSRDATRSTPVPVPVVKDWVRGVEAASSSSRAASSGDVAPPFRQSRSLRLLQAESRKLGERRLVAFISAVAFLTLAWYGQDLLTQLGRITRLPIEELDGLIYFLVGFFAVSLVLPKSRYTL
ncbi:hypothetical protein Agub_g15082 [Astrephomene gubernaculifera]|uniref:Uncharacterized protein n=1 Tax=Astrephomene gubernaculifera TaxID=47775 RepID=A0AAD3HTP7_9CHLO|nr:hypothetical protein Agub_g15082 [Astrephomene gubernaculifera]